MHTAYLAATEYATQLAEELRLRGIAHERLSERLFLSPDPAQSVAWAVNTWYDVERLPIDSIGQAAACLRDRGPYWAPHHLSDWRRCQLIAERLLRVKHPSDPFPIQRRLKNLGAFCLCDAHTLLCAPRTSRPWPDGAVRFQEDRTQPPARAYLKCWEALTLLGSWPGPGETVRELGAAPGAWTWTLAGLGAQVHAIDKAPLEPRIAALPNVCHEQGSAFALDPHEEQVDWLFSDVICYPERLFRLIDSWLAVGHCPRYVITIKFQGATDYQTMRHFQELPGSWLVHLHNNKHELTWLYHPGLTDQPTGAWVDRPASDHTRPGPGPGRGRPSQTQSAEKRV